MKSRSYRIIAGLAIFGFFLFGLASINRYGYGDDEQWLIKRGEMSYATIRAVMAGHLGRAKAVSTEPAEWAYHPSFYGLLNYQWVSPLLQRAGIGEIPSRHLLNLLVASLALVAMFRLAVEMLGEEEALYAVLLLMFFPRFTAHAQFNPKDIPALACVAVFIFYTYRGSGSGRLKDAAAAGFWMGLAATAHIGSLVLLPLFPAALVYGIRRRLGISCLVFLGMAVLVFFLLWPSLWFHPFGLIDSIRHFSGDFSSGQLLYFGRFYSRSTVPWHYYPFFVAASLPLLTWLFVGAGLWRFKDGKQDNRRAAAWFILLAWAAIPIVVRMNPWVVKYNGIRHVFISIPPFMIIGGRGAKILMDFARAKAGAGRRLAVTTAIGIGVLAYGIRQESAIFPYGGDYFNEALRWVYPRQLEDMFEFPSWLTCQRDVVDWLNAHAAPQSIVAVPHRISVLSMYQKRPDLIFVNTLPGNYTVVSGPDFVTRWRYEKRLPIFEVRRYGSRLVAIFKDMPSPAAPASPS